MRGASGCQGSGDAARAARVEDLSVQRRGGPRRSCNRVWQRAVPWRACCGFFAPHAADVTGASSGAADAAELLHTYTQL